MPAFLAPLALAVAPAAASWTFNKFGGGGGGGGGGLGGLLPGSGGFSLQNDAMTRSMNLSDSLKRMGEEQYGQESPYRANMLQMIQERANQQ